MKNLTLFLVAFLGLVLSVKAQGTVTLCEDYDKTDGTPSGIYKNWDIKSSGGFVYIVYRQDRIISDKLLLFVDKKNTAGQYIVYDTQDIDYNPKSKPQKWAMYDYEFKEAGEYEISIVAVSTEKTLATTQTKISIINGSVSNADNNNSDDEVDTYYYENSSVVFAKSIDSDANTNGESTTFRLENGKCDFYAKLQQDDDLLLTQLIVDVYGGDDYKELIDSQTYDIESKTWNWVKVPINLTKRGKYVVDMYTQDDVYINSGYVEVK